MKHDGNDPTHQLEVAGEALPGIRRVRVERETRRPKVRALVAPERSDRDARKMLGDLASRLGMDLPPAQIEILRAGEPGAHAGPRRRRLMSLTTERVDDRFSARVVLELAGDLLVGQSEAEAHDRAEEHHVVADAVLAALSEVLDFAAAVRTVDSVNDGMESMSVVMVDAERGPMLGAARHRRNEHDAVARATLDALNRVAVR